MRSIVILTERFYVTLLQDQAEEFARRKARDRKGKPVISIYEFDYDAAIKDCAYLNFEFYDEAWLDFVVASRNGMKPWANYDIVEGGVANDRVIDTVELYTIGILDKASALGRLSEHQPNHQICILSQAILDKYLKFVTFGNNTGERRPQNLASPCHKYSLPFFLML